MQSIMLSSSELKQIVADFEDVLREAPDSRAQMYERIGQALLAAVHGRIGGGGRVRNWQDNFVGTGKGYAAVRAKAKTYDKSTSGKRYAVGYITNAIENGHKQEKGRFVPGLVTESYWGGYTSTGAKLVRDSVPGKYFYAEARKEAEQIAYAEAERFAKQLAERLNGG